MKKTKNKTFAQRAIDIEKKYPKAKWDAIEKRDLERDMEALIDEQEAFRQANGMGDQQVMATGGGIDSKTFYPTNNEDYLSFQLANDYSFPEDFLPDSVTGTGQYGLTRDEYNKFVVNGGLSNNDLYNAVRSARGMINPSASANPTPPITQVNRDTTSMSPINSLPITSLPVTSNQGLAPINNRVKAISNSSVPQSLIAEGSSNFSKSLNAGFNPSVATTTINPSIPYMASIGARNVGNSSLSNYDLNTIKSAELPKLNNFKNANTNKVNSITEDGEGSDFSKYLPSIASGVGNIASNLILANMSKKGLKRNVPSIGVANRINLEPQANMLRADAATAKNIARRNVRSTGNTGQVLSNVNASSATIDKNLNDALTRMYLGQEQFNVGAANQFSLSNMQARNASNMYNTQIQNQNLQDRLGYTGAALGTIPGVMKDINMMNADEKTRLMYENYIKSLGRNYQYSGNLFGTNPVKYGVRG